MHNDEQTTSGRGDYIEKWSHHKWSYLIVSTNDYLVCLDMDGDIDWETSPDYDAKESCNANFDLVKKNAVMNDAALLEVTPCEGFPKAISKHFKRLIGEALGCCFDFDYQGAANMLLAAQKYVIARSEETSRSWYLTASFLTTIPFMLCGTVLWIWRIFFVATLGTIGLWCALGTVAGAVGALLSVIARTGRLKFDCSAGWQLHYLEGGSRIAAGAISGLLAALAVNSGVIFTVFTQNSRSHVVMMLTALAAGASERLATSIISKFDATQVKVSELDGDKKTTEGQR